MKNDRVKIMLIVFAMVLYAGLVAIACIFNGSAVETVQDIAIVSIGAIIGYIIKASVPKTES